jgi:hypothetical protein
VSNRFPRPIDALGGVASGQSGYFTRAQANEKGMDDVSLNRLIKSGRIRRVAHGVYAFVGVPPLRHEDLLAAWLRLQPERPAYERVRDPDAIVSGLSAAALYDIGDVAPTVNDFVVRESRRAPKGMRLRKGAIERSSWEVVEGFPVQRPQYVLAFLFREHVDREHLVDMAVDAVVKGLVRNADISQAMRGVNGPSDEVDEFLERVLKRTARGLRELEVNVVDGDLAPVASATILASAPNMTFKVGTTNQSGIATISVVEGRPYVLFVASARHYGVIDDVAADENHARIEMVEANSGGGSSIFQAGEGYVPALSGRFNPIKDQHGRTYLYADNIAIEGGVPQPYRFAFDDWFDLEDADGVCARVCVRGIRAAACLLDYEVELHD